MDDLIFILFLIFWVVVIALIVIIEISTIMKKREIKKLNSDADKFVDEFKTRIKVVEGIEKELKKRGKRTI